MLARLFSGIVIYLCKQSTYDDAKNVAQLGPAKERAPLTKSGEGKAEIVRRGSESSVPWSGVTREDQSRRSRG